MADELLSQLRRVRRIAERLNETLVGDYRPFYSGETLTFVRLPSHNKKQINVTPTCTALMALSLGQALGKVYVEDSAQLRTTLSIVFQNILSEPWDTGKMKANNAFTTSLVLRAASTLTTNGLGIELDSLTRKQEDRETVDGNLQDIADEWRRLNTKTLSEICALIIRNAPNSFRVQDYPASATIAYWIVDAAAGMEVKVDEASAKRLVNWSNAELSRQVSLVAANHHAMMDPIAMAMAACLFRALRRMAQRQETIRQALEDWSPTDVELVNAVRVFFEKQNSAGVWEKYFPIFHYPAAGPNHCWHFEVLEAVLNEFPDLLEDSKILARIETGLKWLTDNRLSYTYNEQPFAGWNSGGDIGALRRGVPESWPTGVAHMSLWRLRSALSNQVRYQVLEKYRDRTKVFNTADDEDWKRFMDADIPMASGLSKTTVRTVLDDQILKPAEQDIQEQRIKSPVQQKPSLSLLPPTFRLQSRISALLFGPPGTSKTTLVESIAKRLGWPFIELSPSDFLRRGLDGIHNQVSEVFEDMADLFGVVILFDEMDALVQSRDETAEKGADLDVTQKFLTTSMLPKLSKLHKQARVLYFMATNHIEVFDQAIRRAGRFDVLLPMGPSSVKEKARSLSQLDCRWFKKETDEDRIWISEQFSLYMKDPGAAAAIGVFTFGEMEEFFDYLRRTFSSKDDLADALRNIPTKKSTFTHEAMQRLALLNQSNTPSAFEQFADDSKKYFRIQ